MFQEWKNKVSIYTIHIQCIYLYTALCVCYRRDLSSLLLCTTATTRQHPENVFSGFRENFSSSTATSARGNRVYRDFIIRRTHLAAVLNKIQTVRSGPTVSSVSVEMGCVKNKKNNNASGHCRVARRTYNNIFAADEQSVEENVRLWKS